jgi:hypothetical protein
MVNAHNVPFYLWDQVLRGSLARQPWHRYLCIVFVDPRIRPLWVFAPYDSVLGCLCLASRKVLGTYPTQSKMVIFDPQSRGWQSLSGLLTQRIVRAVYLCQVLLITHGWPPCKLSLLSYLYPSRFFHWRFLAKFPPPT